MADTAERVTAARGGSVRAIARLVTAVETGGHRAAEVAAALAGLPRDAHIIGITGAPGAGKSTLTGRLLQCLRGAEQRVAVLAVDPSSPFTGGALLGDRVRMADFATDSGVFIRSLSSRGHLGGLSAATPAAVDLMSALGFDTVIVETVGVGQSEIDVMNLADTVVVLLAPGMGDAIQAAKAGIMEIGDILVVNKADHAGARNTVRELKAMLMLAAGAPKTHGAPGPLRESETPRWSIEVLSTVAETGDGVAQLYEAMRRHRDYLADSGRIAMRRQARASAAIEAIVTDRLRRALSGEAGRAELARAAEDVISGDGDAYVAAETVLDWLRRDV